VRRFLWPKKVSRSLYLTGNGGSSGIRRKGLWDEQLERQGPRDRPSLLREWHGMKSNIPQHDDFL
jgi:hypothetical protein